MAMASGPTGAQPDGSGTAQTREFDRDRDWPIPATGVKLIIASSFCYAQNGGVRFLRVLKHRQGPPSDHRLSHPGIRMVGGTYGTTCGQDKRLWMLWLRWPLELVIRRKAAGQAIYGEDRGAEQLSQTLHIRFRKRPIAEFRPANCRSKSGSSFA